MEKNYNEVTCDSTWRWGLLTDEDLKENNFYGARTIAERSYDRKSVRLDFVPGRSMAKGCVRDLDKMVKFLNKNVKAIGKFVNACGLGSMEVYAKESPEGIKLEATPHGSDGYVYIKMTWNGEDKRKVSHEG